jgi:predicted ATPase
MRPVWAKRTRRGFFLRAEDFFGYVKQIKASLGELAEQGRRVREENAHLPSGEIARIAGPYEASAAALRGRYGEDMDALSHGEQFLAFFQSRVVPGGLYLLDEPEVALSPARQLAFLSLLKDSAAESECQFVIATHSPILMAFPGARILGFDEPPIREVAYDALEHVRFTRDFLNRPEAFLRYL